MTTLLVGGTGLLGGAAAEALVARGEPVRALVRSGKRAGHLRALGVELEVGDLLDKRSLRRALAGARAVITTAQGDPSGGRRTSPHVDDQGNHNLIAAAGQARVERFVFVSALKADEGAASVPQLRYKYAAEEQLRASGIDYTILRPSTFQETFGDEFVPFKQLIERFGIGLAPGGGQGKHSFVAVADVARAAVLSLNHQEAHQQIVPIGGPEDLSDREAYARIAQISGRRVVVVPLPRPLLWVGRLLTAPGQRDLRSSFRLVAFGDRAGYTCVTPTWLVDALGRRRTLDEGVRAMYLAESREPRADNQPEGTRPTTDH